MTVAEWFEMQGKLDRYIEEEHHLEEEDLVERKILALLVETGELANETRCFKFWSLKPASERKTILEEFVDGVHFVLSIGLELGYEDTDISIVANEDNEDLVQSFLSVYHLTDELRRTRSRGAFGHLLRQYFLLGQTLGFSVEEVQRAYMEKNEVNYRRQREGY